MNHPGRVPPPPRRGKSPGRPDEGSPVTRGESPPARPEGRTPGAVVCGVGLRRLLARALTQMRLLCGQSGRER